jgi:hypothetical protein
MLGILSFGIKEAALMFALGFGYIICYLAKKQDKGMQSLGHVIGMSIIVLSSILIFLNLYIQLSLGTSKQVMASYLKYPVMQGSMMGQGAMQAPVKTPVKK